MKINQSFHLNIFISDFSSPMDEREKLENKEIPIDIFESVQIDFKPEKAKKRRNYDDYDYNDPFLESFEGEFEAVDLECKLENFFIFKGKMEEDPKRIARKYNNSLKKASLIETIQNTVQKESDNNKKKLVFNFEKRLLNSVNPSYKYKKDIKFDNFIFWLIFIEEAKNEFEIALRKKLMAYYYHQESNDNNLLTERFPEDIEKLKNSVESQFEELQSKVSLDSSFSEDRKSFKLFAERWYVEKMITFVIGYMKFYAATTDEKLSHVKNSALDYINAMLPEQCTNGIKVKHYISKIISLMIDEEGYDLESVKNGIFAKKPMGIPRDSSIPNLSLSEDKSVDLGSKDSTINSHQYTPKSTVSRNNTSSNESKIVPTVAKIKKDLKNEIVKENGPKRSKITKRKANSGIEDSFTDKAKDEQFIPSNPNQQKISKRRKVNSKIPDSQNILNFQPEIKNSPLQPTILSIQNDQDTSISPQKTAIELPKAKVKGFSYPVVPVFDSPFTNKTPAKTTLPIKSPNKDNLKTFSSDYFHPVESTTLGSSIFNTNASLDISKENTSKPENIIKTTEEPDRVESDSLGNKFKIPDDENSSKLKNENQHTLDFDYSKATNQNGLKSSESFNFTNSEIFTLNNEPNQKTGNFTEESSNGATSTQNETTKPVIVDELINKQMTGEEFKETPVKSQRRKYKKKNNQ